MDKIRTLKGAIEEIKAIDKNTAITLYSLRRLTCKGEINVIKSGNKTLVNMAELFRYYGMYE